MRVDSKTNYAEMLPARCFSGQVVCFWSHRVNEDNAGFRQSVYPDGCVDILWRGNSADGYGTPVVVGAMTRVRAAALDDGLRLAGIRLFPGQAAALLGVPASEFTDREAPLRELKGFRRFAENVSGRALADPNAVFARLLACRSQSRLDTALAGAIHAIARDPRLKIGTLAARQGVSERQLHRRFMESVGFGPKHLLRVLRFQRFLTLAARPVNRIPGSNYAQDEKTPALADLALAAGYADQSHLSRDCRNLAGDTPRSLLADSHPALAASGLFD